MLTQTSDLMTGRRVVFGENKIIIDSKLGRSNYQIIGNIKGTAVVSEVLTPQGYKVLCDKQAFFNDEEMKIAFTYPLYQPTPDIVPGRLEKIAARAALYDALEKYPNADYIILPRYTFKSIFKVMYLKKQGNVLSAGSSSHTIYTNTIRATIQGKAIRLKTDTVKQ